nr:immunoglobulin heavy chain junction region [Mus musculus]
CTLIVHFDVW